MAGKKQLPQLLEATLLVRGIDVRDADELAFMAQMVSRDRPDAHIPPVWQRSLRHR